MSFTESIVQSRLNREAGELEMSLRATGQTFESLPLSLGDTTVDREVLPDGTKGQIRICTQEAEDILRTSIVYNRYLLKDGQIVTDPSYGEAERRVRGLKKAKILARIAFGRVDHWDLEGDFEGISEEFDE